ncbi:hypothetical protein C8J27_10734 [Rhodobacter aestuarii]|uniref:Uncharacterized protein n=1 Tax=Rhodobacter aestuarii TaxID=453582 RepID=A0A1N7NWP1_9RHOB|nr:MULTISPECIES: hypothetical protein [Rhodobacter]PTV94503.1 hypothetical protein C8J27_10734 [Rhodobacter aestuarii]SIT02718.1 hypothetical protein SAMN05421580_108193 [Rhodobacter aestuarii]SOC12230.1 hypothetical protein SAMN05877809_10634 [Rhodobacter sp. JA431]
MGTARNSVNQIVTRYARLHHIDPDGPCRDSSIEALFSNRLDSAGLDRTECLIVEFRRDQLISDRRMVDLLRRHQKEVSGRV